ncbi:hypothetical protein NWF32_06255 [Pseudomonas qingdaonensis]|nr:hypothetical protein [Pseudomonas qingdaonensis]
MKPHDRLKIASVRQRLDAAERYFNATARNFSVITEKLIEAEPLATNLRRLMYHRRGPELSHQALEEVMATFNEWPPMTVADLLYVVGEGKAWRLLGLGVVGIDLDRSIDTDSPVFLQGGTVMQTFSLRVKLVVIVRGVLMVLEKRLIDRKLLFSMSLVSPRSYPRRSSMRPTRSARSRSPLISHTLGGFRMCGTSLQIFHASQKTWR